MSHSAWKAFSGVTVSGASVTLRPLHIDDVDLIGRWRNNAGLRQVLGMDYPVSHASVCEWVQQVTSGKDRNPTSVVVAICVRKRMIGTAGIHNISQRHRHGTLGIYIGETKSRKLGIGRLVYQLLITYAFQELDLRNLCAYVYGHNESSIRLHESLGFQKVGCIPGLEYRGGEYQDFLTYCLSRQDWITAKR